MNPKRDTLVRRVVFGPFRAPATTDLEKYLFLRRYCVLLSIPVLLSVVLALAYGAPTVVWIVVGVGVVAWLTTIVKLPFDLRRERRRATNGVTHEEARRSAR
jgi:hypothetical protein